MEIHKLIKFLKYSKSWERLIKIFGKMLQNLKTLKGHFQNGEEDNFKKLMIKYQNKE